MPASTRVRTAQSLCRGDAVPGSVRRQTASSRVGMETFTSTSTRARRGGEDIDVAHDQRPRVTMLKGVRAAARASRHPRVSR